LSDFFANYAPTARLDRNFAGSMPPSALATVLLLLLLVEAARASNAPSRFGSEGAPTWNINTKLEIVNSGYKRGTRRITRLLILFRQNACRQSILSQA
jgi:hypothetical protein